MATTNPFIGYDTLRLEVQAGVYYADITHPSCNMRLILGDADAVASVFDANKVQHFTYGDDLVLNSGKFDELMVAFRKRSVLV
jgi:hypothetical protein